MPETEFYEFIEAENDAVDESGPKIFTIAKMSVWIGVSKSSFLRLAVAPGIGNLQRRAHFTALIVKILAHSDRRRSRNSPLKRVPCSDET